MCGTTHRMSPSRRRWGKRPRMISRAVSADGNARNVSVPNGPRPEHEYRCGIGFEESYGAAGRTATAGTLEDSGSVVPTRRPGDHAGRWAGQDATARSSRLSARRWKSRWTSLCRPACRRRGPAVDRESGRIPVFRALPHFTSRTIEGRISLPRGDGFRAGMDHGHTKGDGDDV